jgi:alkylhydroperoxidase/carboxymuconolactone decarboxylase family protein YurZ
LKRLPSIGGIDFRLQRVRKRLARLGSFSAAARVRSSTPSSVTRQIDALEESLGTTLFVRSTRMVRLTDAGRLLLERAAPILAPRDRSIATVAALIATGAFEELPAHLRRAETNGVKREELAALITHLAFYAGFLAAITASAIAHQTLTQATGKSAWTRAFALHAGRRGTMPSGVKV